MPLTERRVFFALPEMLTAPTEPPRLIVLPAARHSQRGRVHAGQVDDAVARGDLDVVRLAVEGDIAAVACDDEVARAYRVSEGDGRAVSRVCGERGHARLAVCGQGHVVAALEHDAVRRGNIGQLDAMYRSGEDDVARQIGDRKVGIARNDAAAGRAVYSEEILPAIRVIMVTNSARVSFLFGASVVAVSPLTMPLATRAAAA